MNVPIFTTSGPRPSRRLLLGALGAGGAVVAAAGPAAADRPPSPGRGRRDWVTGRSDWSENVVFPEEAYAKTVDDVGVIDVKRLFGAKGDGVTDDTAALVAAYDLVHERYLDTRNDPDASQNIIYLPDGEYLVSDTVVYSGPYDTMPNDNENNARIRFQGQSRDGVTIRLADGSAGFGPGADKPVLSFAKGYRNGTVASNYVQNLTIDTGSGNPGATGLLFCGANNASVRHVTIRAAEGEGVKAVSLPIWVTQGTYEDLDLVGFDHGFHCETPRGYLVVLDGVRMTGQRVSGIECVDSCVSARRIVGDMPGAAARVTGEGGHLVIVESFLQGRDGSLPAIDSQDGQLLARDLTTGGYAYAVRRAGSVAVAGNNVSEYVSSPVATLFEQSRTTSLALPVQESPRGPWPDDLSQWESVLDHGAVGDGETDDTAAVQSAMDAGKPVVWFPPNHVWKLDGTVTIPGSVERVNFMYTHVLAGAGLAEDQGMFAVGDGSSPLMLERHFGWANETKLAYFVDHASTRTLVLQDVHLQQGPMYRNSVRGGTVFLDSCSARTAFKKPELGKTAFVFDHVTAFVRFANPAYGQPNILNRGGDVWLFGVKAEGPWTVFETEEGGRTEILGAIFNVYHGGWDLDPERPVVRNTESSVSASLSTFHEGANVFETAVAETRDGETRLLAGADLPFRLNNGQFFVPSYVGTP
ncbi:hypothetical protein KC207_05160 [Phycicoccus sp. BSK3Z-2]|uniref:Rhamnogalacturonase A/B/Epimerase-like pectate lyase domain-containing protein n=1 Tax=Phycicoccus avicenniae TaxID=2828860 RepID=A0A941D738_9MICO|nr:glycosyl hydrolase family 28-related protein [Phycicoccus avicenniae]MBR7742676.1 hypothetical protein [Phycicoccus avicenniae]